MNELLQYSISMQTSNQPFKKSRLNTASTFSKRSRESYFAMMEVAHRNLSIVDEKEEATVVALKKHA